MTREEHLEWAKLRALEFMDSGDHMAAMSSIISDLNKFEGLALTRVQLVEVRDYVLRGDGSLRSWIEALA